MFLPIPIFCYPLTKVDIEDEIKRSDSEEEEKDIRRKSIDDLWSEIRDDDKSVEMPQVEKVSITLKPDELESTEVAIQSSKNTEAEAIALSNKVDVIKEEKKQIKVSTACGPSPDREIEELLRNEANEKPITVVTREIPVRSSSRVSIGTSPPPQSISTQVREFSSFGYFYNELFFSPIFRHMTLSHLTSSQKLFLIIRPQKMSQVQAELIALLIEV